MKPGAPATGLLLWGEAMSNAQQRWRAWYKLARWQRLRLKVFIRDGYVCQRSGVLCIGKHPAEDSPVANHKTPHRGSEALFWDEDNIETVSKAVHDSEVQQEEQATLQQRGVWY